MPGAALDATEHPEGRRKGLVERLDVVIGVAPAVVPELLEQRASKADTAMLLLVFYDHGPRCMLEDAEIDVPVDGLPLTLKLLVRPLVAQVEVSHAGRHAVHREVAGFGEG